MWYWSQVISYIDIFGASRKHFWINYQALLKYVVFGSRS
jgi:hypothetical protein